MDKLFKIFFLFLFLVLPWDTRGAGDVSDQNDIATIQAANDKNSTSTNPFRRVGSFAVHHQAKGEGNTLNSLFRCNTSLDSKEDTIDDIVVEKFVQRYAAVFLAVFDSTGITPTTRKLIFPFHFFL